MMRRLSVLFPGALILAGSLMFSGCSSGASPQYKAMIEYAHQVSEPEEEVKDINEFAALRADYKEAILSDNNKELSALLTSDYVLLQSVKFGPDTFGQKAWFRYRQLLDKITNLVIEPLRVIQFGPEWGLEIGREYTSWKAENGEEYETLGTVNREKNGNTPGPPWYGPAEPNWYYRTATPLPLKGNTFPTITASENGFPER